MAAVEYPKRKIAIVLCAILYPFSSGFLAFMLLSVALTCLTTMYLKDALAIWKANKKTSAPNPFNLPVAANKKYGSQVEQLLDFILARKPTLTHALQQQTTPTSTPQATAQAPAATPKIVIKNT